MNADLLTLSWIMAALALVAAGALVGCLLPWLKATQVSTAPHNAEHDAKLPGVSIVAYGTPDDAKLEAWFENVSTQQHPDFEVIVVLDATAETTAMLNEKYAAFKNVRFTFIPPGSHNLSRRKLAQTLGMKSATKPNVLFTSVSVMPQSPQWLALITAPLAHGNTSAVLGYAATDIKQMRGAGKWYRQFDHLLTSAQWIADAIRGKAWRGDGYNLAVSRNAFFEHKGYAATINLENGDDDIFVSNLAKDSNVVAVTQPEASVIMNHGEKYADYTLRDLKERYAFTKRFLPKHGSMTMATRSWSQWIMTLSATDAIVLAIVGYMHTNHTVTVDAAILLLPAILAALTLVAIWAWQIAAYRRLAKAYGAVRLFWAVVPFMLWHPIGNFLFRLNHLSTHKTHYTWQR